MKRSGKKRTFDDTLLVTVLILVFIGLILLYSTSAYNGRVKFHDSLYYLKKQGFATALGLAGMTVVAKIDYHRLFPPILAQSCFLLRSCFSEMNITGPEDGFLWARFHFSLLSMQRLRLYSSLPGW